MSQGFDRAKFDECNKEVATALGKTLTDLKTMLTQKHGLDDAALNNVLSSAALNVGVGFALVGSGLTRGEHEQLLHHVELLIYGAINEARLRGSKP